MRPVMIDLEKSNSTNRLCRALDANLDHIQLKDAFILATHFNMEVPEVSVENILPPFVSSY